MFLQKKIMESVASFKGLTTVYLCLRAFLFGNWKDSILKLIHLMPCFPSWKLPSYLVSATTNTRCFGSKFWNPGLQPASCAVVHQVGWKGSSQLWVDLPTHKCMTEASLSHCRYFYSHVLCNTVFCGIKFHRLFANVKKKFVKCCF